MTGVDELHREQRDHDANHDDLLKGRESPDLARVYEPQLAHPPGEESPAPPHHDGEIDDNDNAHDSAPQQHQTGRFGRATSELSQRDEEREPQQSGTVDAHVPITDREGHDLDTNPRCRGPTATDQAVDEDEDTQDDRDQLEPKHDRHSDCPRAVGGFPGLGVGRGQGVPQCLDRGGETASPTLGLRLGPGRPRPCQPMQPHREGHENSSWHQQGRKPIDDLGITAASSGLAGETTLVPVAKDCHHGQGTDEEEP